MIWGANLITTSFLSIKQLKNTWRAKMFTWFSVNLIYSKTQKCILKLVVFWTGYHAGIFYRQVTDPRKIRFAWKVLGRSLLEQHKQHCLTRRHSLFLSCYPLLLQSPAVRLLASLNLPNKKHREQSFKDDSEKYVAFFRLAFVF